MTHPIHRPARRMARYGVAVAIALAATATRAAPVASLPPPPPAPIAVALHPDLDRPGTTFEGWGTALAWFANVTGGWPDADRTRLADLLFGADGLGFTIARYNIGGGNAADAPPYLRPGAAVPGFWKLRPGQGPHPAWRAYRNGDWNWSADGRQRWWLNAVRARVPDPIFEAFSNSPPWFMTVSGRVSGAAKVTDDNLAPGFEKPFAGYLARVVDELQRRHRIAFRTLSPVNEPDTDYWYAANTQEGSHWDPPRQAAMIDAAGAALRARHLSTRIAAPDETNSAKLLTDWAAYPAATRARIGQINVHSYGTIFQTGVRDIARASGIRLWMSENDTPLPGDPEDFDGMPSALALAEHVVADLKRLEPAAWVFWQAVEDLSARGDQPGTNWGLIKADLRAGDAAPHPIHVTRKYWAMMQFSRYIRPGDRLVRVDDPDTAGALSPDGARLVLVHVNPGPVPRRLTVPPGWHARLILTDDRHEATDAAAGTGPLAADLVAPSRSIATMVLTRDPLPAGGSSR